MKVDVKNKKITYHEKEKEVMALTGQLIEEYGEEGLTHAQAAAAALSVLPTQRVHHHLEHEPAVPAADPGFVYILSGGNLRMIDGILTQVSPWGDS